MYIDYALLKRMLRPFLEVVKLRQGDLNLSLVSYNMYKRRQLPSIDINEDLKARLAEMEEDFVEFYCREMDKCN